MATTTHHYATVNVDVDIDDEDLRENGYHHEDDCPAQDLPDMAEDLQTLMDWHYANHNPRLWAMCRETPCKDLTDYFRSPK